MVRSPRSGRGSGTSSSSASSRRLDLDLAERLVRVHTAQGSLVVALFRLDLLEQVFLVPPLGFEHLLMRRFGLQPKSRPHASAGRFEKKTRARREGALKENLTDLGVTRADDKVFSRSSLDIGLEFLLLFRRRLELLFHLQHPTARTGSAFFFFPASKKGTKGAVEGRRELTFAFSRRSVSSSSRSCALSPLPPAAAAAAAELLSLPGTGTGGGGRMAALLVADSCAGLWSGAGGRLIAGAAAAATEGIDTGFCCARGGGGDGLLV